MTRDVGDHGDQVACAQATHPLPPVSTPFHPIRPHSTSCWDVMQRVTGQKHENPAFAGLVYCIC